MISHYAVYSPSADDIYLWTAHPLVPERRIKAFLAACGIVWLGWL